MIGSLESAVFSSICNKTQAFGCGQEHDSFLCYAQPEVLSGPLSVLFCTLYKVFERLRKSDNMAFRCLLG
jgi:hypothetical protein